MKKIFYFLLLALPLFTLSFCNSSSGEKNIVTKLGKENGSNIIANKNIAVLELFTSQGCSSCPAAERLLEPYVSKENVVLLSYHVDYWDRLGWKDPFSSQAFTQRQYDYASVLHSDVYTPQLVVNGENEMVGSDANKINNTLDKVLSETVNSSAIINNIENTGNKVIVHYNVSGATSNEVLNIALAEKKVITEVKAGENGGATLTGNNVVMSLTSFSVQGNGDAINEVNIPESAGDHKNLIVIIFLQNKKTHKISGASEASL